jgi:catechol 2,3-dioxygenase-like lactoylglutathione lyase family enzyme
MPGRVHHVDLPMKDFQATYDFYSRVLGWRISEVAGLTSNGWVKSPTTLPKDAKPRLIQVSFDDGSYLAFIIGKAPDYTGDEPHVAVRLRHGKERRDLIARLKENKVEFEDNVGENIAFYDPNGLRIEIY